MPIITKEKEDFIEHLEGCQCQRCAGKTPYEDFAKGGKVLPSLTLNDWKGGTSDSRFDKLSKMIDDRDGYGSVYSYEEKLTEDPNRKNNGLGLALHYELKKFGKNASGSGLWNFIRFNYPSKHKYRKWMKDSRDIENFDKVIGTTDKEAVKHAKLIDKLVSDKQLEKDWKADAGDTQQHWYEKGGIVYEVVGEIPNEEGAIIESFTDADKAVDFADKQWGSSDGDDWSVQAIYPDGGTAEIWYNGDYFAKGGSISNFNPVAVKHTQPWDYTQTYVVLLKDKNSKDEISFQVWIDRDGDVNAEPGGGIMDKDYDYDVFWKKYGLDDYDNYVKVQTAAVDHLEREGVIRRGDDAWYYTEVKYAKGGEILDIGDYVKIDGYGETKIIKGYDEEGKFIDYQEGDPNSGVMFWVGKEDAVGHIPEKYNEEFFKIIKDQPDGGYYVEEQGRKFEEDEWEDWFDLKYGDEYRNYEGFGGYVGANRLEKTSDYAKGGEVKKGNEMLIGGIAGILLGIFFNK